MNDLPRQKLCEITAGYGLFVCEDIRWCRALLHNQCPSCPEEVNALVGALEQWVPQNLLTHSDRQAWGPASVLLVHRLISNLGMREETARWAVESWVQALKQLPTDAHIAWSRGSSINEGQPRPGTGARDERNESHRGNSDSEQQSARESVNPTQSSRIVSGFRLITKAIQLSLAGAIITGVTLGIIGAIAEWILFRTLENERWIVVPCCAGITGGLIGGFIAGLKNRSIWRSILLALLGLLAGSFVATASSCVLAIHGWLTCFIVEALSDSEVSRFFLCLVVGALGGLVCGLIMVVVIGMNDGSFDQMMQRESPSLARRVADAITKTWVDCLIDYVVLAIELIVERLRQSKEIRLLLLVLTAIGVVNCYLFHLVRYLGIADLAACIILICLTLFILGFAVAGCLWDPAYDQEKNK